MANTDVLIGSWFPSGYHGHFRSKCRLDFVNDYRHSSKPLPPRKFVTRSKLRPSYNIFSKHDNRNSFTKGAVYFESGLGRRLYEPATRPNTDFLAWMPEKKEWDKSLPDRSVYRVNYQPTPSTPIKDPIARRAKTSFGKDSPVMTTYRFNHGNNTNGDALRAISDMGLPTTPNRRIHSNWTSRGSVASCMNWNEPARKPGPMPKRHSQVCPQTSLVPHPPTSPRTAQNKPVASTTTIVTNGPMPHPPPAKPCPCTRQATQISIDQTPLKVQIEPVSPITDNCTE